MKRILGLALTMALCMVPLGGYADPPKPEQLKVMIEISEQADSDWPKLLREHHSIIDTNIVTYLGERSQRALARRFEPNQSSNNISAGDHDAFFFALLADDAAREGHLPIIWRLQLADGYWKRGLAAQAYDVLDNIVTWDSHMVEPYMLGGTYLMQTKNYEEARPRFETVLKLSPRNEGALLGLAQIEFIERNPLKARAALHRLLSEYPKNEQGRAMEKDLASIEPKIGAIGPVTGPVVPKEVVELVEKGRQELFSGQVSDAEATAQAAVSKAPQYPDANALLGDVLMRQNKYEAAADAYEKAAAQPPQKAESFHYEGLAYELAFGQTRKSDNLDKAIEAYQEAVRLEPDNDNYKTELSRALKLKG